MKKFFHVFKEFFLGGVCIVGTSFLMAIGIYHVIMFALSLDEYMPIQYAVAVGFALVLCALAFTMACIVAIGDWYIGRRKQ